MRLKLPIIILSILVLVSGNSCETVDCQALCAAPPDGEIVADKVNVTTFILVHNNDGATVQIDGAIQLLAGGNWIDLTNYTWTQVSTQDAIAALRFTLEGTTYTIDQENFTFINADRFEAGSFLMSIKLNSDTTTVLNDLLSLEIMPFDGRCEPNC